MQVAAMVGKMGNVTDRMLERDSPSDHAQSVYENGASANEEIGAVSHAANIAPDIKFTKLEIVQ